MPAYFVRDRMRTSADFTQTNAEAELNPLYGEINGNNPCILPPPMPGTRNLETNDIKGSQADTLRLGPFTYYKRRPEQVR
jgi:hypothetical protein